MNIFRKIYDKLTEYMIKNTFKIKTKPNISVVIEVITKISKMVILIIIKNIKSEKSGFELATN